MKESTFLFAAFLLVAVFTSCVHLKLQVDRPIEAVMYKLTADSKTHELLWGEFVIKPDGIYTYVHYYRHPQTGRKIVMAGMNHGGDKEYFEKIAGILDDCEIVLYEASPPTSKTEAEKEEEKREKQKENEAYFKMLDGDNIEAAFYATTRAYFVKAVEYLAMPEEGDFFNRAKPGWESGDAEFFERFKNDKELEKKFEVDFQEKLARCSLEWKKKAIDFTRAAIAKIEKKEFTKRDFGGGFIFFWSHPVNTEITLGMLGLPRDEMVFEKFDKVVKEKNPRTVGIKFGAGHINNQRKLLEQRGYLYLYSIELRNLAF